MRLDNAAGRSNSVTGAQGAPRLAFYLLMAVVLMVMDQQGQIIPRFRAAAETLVQPVYFLAESPARMLRAMRTYTRSYTTLQDENRAWEEQLLVQSGEVQRLNALEEENRRLRALLQATQDRNMEFRFAEMVMVSLDPYSHQVLIDRGSSDGVFIGQAVIDGSGVMGQVESVQSGQARVRLISDPAHAIPVQIVRTGQRTVALGTGAPGRLLLPNLPKQSDIREGDVLISSGLGERFPAGFPVAEVVRVDRQTGSAFLDVDARPLAALDRGKEVLLVLPGDAPVTDVPKPGVPAETNAGEPVVTDGLSGGEGSSELPETDATMASDSPDGESP